MVITLPSIRFITGIGALTGAAFSELKESNAKERQWEERLKKGYSQAAQSRYDLGSRYPYKEFDIGKIKEEIKSDYPWASDLLVHEVAMTATAKKLFEDETEYVYEVPERMNYFDLDKYAADEFRLRKGI